MFSFLKTPPDPIKMSAERCRRSLALFVQRGWNQIDETALEWNWHLDEMCASLEAASRDEIKDLVINIPPGHAKSIIVSVFWPAWEWTFNPGKATIASGYLDALVNRDAVRFRDLINSPWYQEHFVRGQWTWKSDQNLKEHMKNTKGGERISITTGSGTGHRADTVIVDDPLSVEMAYSPIERKLASRWFFETMTSRAKTARSFKRVIIMQRLHEDDLAGEAIKRGGFQKLILPSEFVVKERAVVVSKTGRVIAQDRRTKEGELLFEKRFPLEALKLAKSNSGMGAQAYSAQHQQKPTPPEGNLIKRHWFNKRWRLPDEQPMLGYETRVLPRPDTLLIVTDATFKKKADSDLVAIGVWGLKWPDLYLIDLIWDRMSFTETLAALLGLVAKWQRVNKVCIEDAANGPAILDTLKTSIPGLHPISPLGGKEARVVASSSFIEAGNVWLPQSVPAHCPGLAKVGALVEESVSFPHAANDDGIDMMAHTINHTLASPDTKWLEDLVSRAVTR